MSNLVNHATSNLINGVSQQDALIRLDNQLQEQVNCFSDITKGLIKRNGVELLTVSELNVTDSFKIPLNIDGIRHLVSLDIKDVVTPVKYIPLSADVDALTVAITGEEYFNEMFRGDLQVLEDKDTVYLLNRRKVVGSGSSRNTFFDVKIIKDTTLTTDTTWLAGEYELTLTSVPAVGSGNVSSGSIVIPVTRSESLQDIADAINAETAFVDEAGLCTLSGTISNYRISFNDIPNGWIYPTVSITETTPITEIIATNEDSGWKFVSGGETYSVKNTSNSTSYEYRYNNVYLGSSNNTTLVKDGYTYTRGALKLSYATSYTGFEPTGPFTYTYSIRRTRTTETALGYTPSVTSPNSSPEDAAGIGYSNRAMLWVTGVSANQTYDVTVNYYDITDPDTILTATSTVSVGTTASNIKLNWVATEIKTDLDADTYLVATVFDNSVLVSSVAGYAISSVDVTNNFDVSSITSVTEAVQSNESGITTISNLPPVFEDGFKLRVSLPSNDTSNYYMKYNSAFRGWKECGLDETRYIDSYTMPYIIDKTKTRENGILLIEPSDWIQALSGDTESNIDPTFIGRRINDMFFYGSRLGFATDDTLVMSEINNFKSFFRTTTSQVKASDRVDIKLDSSKVGYDPIKHVVTNDGKLLINTGSNQSLLLVNQAFDLASAKLSEVSSFSLGTEKPIPVGSGLYFGISNDDYTNIYNYSQVSGSTYDATELTKHCPRYIVGDFRYMDYSADVTVVSTFDNNRTLYIQNRYSQGNSILQNAWHKWTFAYDIEHFYFFNNDLFIIFNTSVGEVNYTLVCKYNIKPYEVQDQDDDSNLITWKPLVDFWTKDKTLIEMFPEFIGVNDETGASFEDVTTAYDSTLLEQSLDDTDLLGPYLDKVGPTLYYWNVDYNTNTIEWDGVTIVFGNNTLDSFDYLGYRYYKGDAEVGDTGYYEVSRVSIISNSYYLNNMLYGIQFNSSITFSKIVPRQQNNEGFTSLSYATLMLRRLRLQLNNSGIFEVTVDFKTRRDYEHKYTGKPLGQFVLGRGTVSDINFSFPVNAKSDLVIISLDTLDTTPFNLLSYEWQGQFLNKGRNI